MTAFSRFTPLAASLPATVPFVGPEAIERQRGLAVRARIGANESGFGPAPSVLSTIAEKSGEIWKYNDPENHALKSALAAHLGLTPQNFVIGEGIDDLLGLIVRLVIEPGMPVVTSLGAYPTFNFHVNGFGGRLVTAPYRDDREDLDSLLALVRQEDAPLVYFANPDNPMGSWWDAGSIVAFARALPPTTLLILDEAYSETAPGGSIPARRCADRSAECHPHPDIFKGLWSGGCSRRLWHRHAGHSLGLRQDPQSFRHAAALDGSRARRPCRSGLSH